MKDKKTARRFVCIHGHFYQPFRKNPWTEEIDIQESAYPYKDWNERINAECYRANAFARILGKDNKLTDIYNNYSMISFNFGPTLLEWIKKNDPVTHKQIIKGDFRSRDFFSGHGTAIAQNYNHLIMPLANRQDKILQVCWAIYDFEKNFKRKPEGMWLAETAVDYETLEVLAEYGIKYTILSPYQAFRFRKHEKNLNESKNLSGRKPDSKGWIMAENGSINTRRPYICILPSGRHISVFFYDKEISTELSFGDLLKNGEAFAQSIINAPHTDENRREIIIIASDGEAYGHHKKFGDMALAYCLKTVLDNKDVALTVFGEYLELFPVEYEVEIVENTAWSCSHSLSRWEGGCTCGIPDNRGEAEWSQEWRVHLRQAINKIRTEIDKIFHENIKKYIKSEIKDPLQIIKDYIAVAEQRDHENIRIFLNKYSDKNKKDKADNSSGFNIIQDDYSASESLLLSLLEMQRQAMLMQSSDAWFFDDISRIEAVQILTHVLMAVRLGSYADPVKTRRAEEEFADILKYAKSNILKGVTGSDIYLKDAAGREYSTEKIAADFITNFLVIQSFKDGSPFCNNGEIFDFCNHEFALTHIFDFEDEMLSGKSGGFYIISKTTLRKEFCLFLLVTDKHACMQKNESNEVLKILIRKKTAGIRNNYRCSPETIFFNEIIKHYFKGNNIEEVFCKLKRKPGFKYFDLNNISKRIKIKFFEKYSLKKIKELYSGLNSYRLYVDSIEEDIKKWIDAYFINKNEDSVFNAAKKSRTLIILNKDKISEDEVAELESLAEEKDSSIPGKHIQTDKRHGRTGFLKSGAEELLMVMIRKYLNNIHDAEMLKTIIRLVKVCKKLEPDIDFSKMQNIVFEIKTIINDSAKNKKDNLNKEIKDGARFLFDFFNIEYFSEDEAF